MHINWDDIDTVLLDMDGTLLDLHYDNYFWSTHLPKRYAQINNIPLVESQQLLSQLIQSLEGSLQWYCLDYWSDTLSLDMGALKAESPAKEKIQERPYAEAFLQFLRGEGKTIVLATNAHEIGLNIKLNETCIGPYFDHIVTSHQFQQPKEVLDFWRQLSHYLTAHIPFDSNRSLFIDDNLTVLNTAQAFGIGHVLGIHQPDSQQIRELKNINAIHHFDEIITQNM